MNKDKIVILKTTPSQSGQKGKTYKIDKTRIVLGSLSSADVQIKGEGVAPIHAVIEIIFDEKNNTVKSEIFDLASETGVFVNEKKVVQQELKNQDEITIGHHRFVFSMGDKVEETRDNIVRQVGSQTLFLNKDEDLAPLNLLDEREMIEIFDFRPTLTRALEVVMSWHGAILAIEHFVHQDAVVVGSSVKEHFAIPLREKMSAFPLVTRIGDAFVLNLNRNMKGVVQKEGELKSLSQLGMPKASGILEVFLGSRDFAKISIDDVDFYLSYTDAPPRLKRRKLFDRDPLFLRVFFTSMVFTAAAFFGLFKMKIPQNIEADQVPERIATILYQPEKFLKPPTETQVELIKTEKEVPSPKKLIVKPISQPPADKEIPKFIHLTSPVTAATKAPAKQRVAKEGEGARAKGKEGLRGELKRPPAPAPVTEISRPSAQKGAGKGQEASQVAHEGNVDIFKGMGGRIQNILGNSSARLGTSGDRLKGFGTFSTSGEGGLALSGKGSGGGGNAETTLGGLGKVGSGMGRVGTGKGAAGNGTGIVGSRVRVSIQANAPEEAVVMGSIDRNAVAEAIFAHKDEFRLCYEREINAENPSLSGQVGTSFVIGPSGRVSQAGIESSSLRHPAVERCVLTVLKRIDFPMPRGGGVVEVHFPFRFSSASRS